MPADFSRLFQTDDVNVTVFRGLEAVLKSDNVLGDLPISWQTWTGSQGEALPPTANQMPWVRLTPLDFTMEPATEIEDEGRFRVRVDVAVNGTRWEDLANLCGAIRDALRRNRPFRDTTVGRFLCGDVAAGSCGANNYWVRKAGVGARRTETPPNDSAVPSSTAVVDQVGSFIVEFQIYYPNID